MLYCNRWGSIDISLILCRITVKCIIIKIYNGFISGVILVDDIIDKLLSSKTSTFIKLFYYVVVLVLTYFVARSNFDDYSHKAFLGSILYGFLILSPIFIGLPGTIFSILVYLFSVLGILMHINNNGSTDHHITLVFYHLTGCIVTLIIHFLYRTIKKYNSKLFNQGYRDFLTSLYNRRYFDMTARYAVEESINNGTSLGLILFDIDYFKQINDNYGHDVGDKILISISELLKGDLRSSDVPCRIGGDEFAVILPDIETEQLKEISRRIMDRINEYNHQNTLLPDFYISIGGAIIINQMVEFKRLFKLADKALYSSKEGGRNAATFNIV